MVGKRAGRLFTEFFESEKAGGFTLIFCAAVSLVLANSAGAAGYGALWHHEVAGLSVAHWINDGLMAIFFLLIGLELERELYSGEISSFSKASLPVFAALGGILLPAGIHLLLNHGTPTQAGAGIPMATDIAFAIGILSLLGDRVPLALKVFLTTLAVIDDLCAILTIALFYTTGIAWFDLGMAAAVFVVLLALNRAKVYTGWPYLLGGVVMWYFMHRSGVHATITGILVAFAYPYGDGSTRSPSYKLQHALHKPVAFLILPLFALANTAIALPEAWFSGLTTSNSLGIALGLIVGKPLGIMAFSGLAVALGISQLPRGLGWKHLLGTGFLAGIGFTMSIFITLLAFDDEALVVQSKIAVMVASLVGALIGLFTLKAVLPAAPSATGNDEED